MARTRRTIFLDEKIEKAQNAVYLTKDKYDAAVEELNQLLKRRGRCKGRRSKKPLKQAREIMTRSWNSSSESQILTRNNDSF